MARNLIHLNKTLNSNQPPKVQEGTIFFNRDDDYFYQYIPEEWSRVCYIVGYDKASWFIPIITTEKEVVQICIDIWDHPSRYSKYEDKSEEAFYEFVKFLWVNYQDGTSKRLMKVAHEHKNESK